MSSTETPPKAFQGALLSADLLFTSQAAGAASRLGGQLRSASSVPALFEGACPEFVLIDLTLPGLEIGDLVRRLKRQPGAPAVIAFGPHVRADLLAGAKEEGCDEVFTRGQLHARLHEVFSRYVRPS